MPETAEKVNTVSRLRAPKELTDEALAALRRGGVSRCVVFADWPALEPEDNVYDEAAFDVLRRDLMTVGSLGIEPVLCLYRGVDPAWFSGRGGWLREDNLRCYLRYAGRVARSVGHLASEYITFYEPNARIWQDDGAQPRLADAVTAISFMACTHIRAVRLIRDTRTQRGLEDTAVGIVMRLYPQLNLRRALLRGKSHATATGYQLMPLLAMALGEFRLPFRNVLRVQRGIWVDFVGVTGAEAPEKREACCAWAEELTGAPAWSVEA